MYERQWGELTLSFEISGVKGFMWILKSWENRSECRKSAGNLFFKESTNPGLTAESFVTGMSEIFWCNLTRDHASCKQPIRGRCVHCLRTSFTVGRHNLMLWSSLQLLPLSSKLRWEQKKLAPPASFFQSVRTFLWTVATFVVCLQ